MSEQRCPFTGEKKPLCKFEQKSENFLYLVTPYLEDNENRALLSTGLTLGGLVDQDIDPNGDCITEVIAMEEWGETEGGISVPVSTILRFSGQSEPSQRVRDIYRIAGALSVMRNVPSPVEMSFDPEAQALERAL